MNRLGIDWARPQRADACLPSAALREVGVGIDERPCSGRPVRKSVGAENTIPADIFTYEAARGALQPIIEKVWRQCEGAGIRGRTVTLKVKYADFQQVTRSRTCQAAIATSAEI
jgi:DNA polymerase-4